MLRPFSIPFSLSLVLMAFPALAGESGKQALPPAAGSELPAETAKDHFRISGGWMWRQIGETRFVSGSRSGGLSLPSLFGSSRFSDPPIGASGSYADRRYADGYVGIDGGTANDGATSLWGYDNAGQVSGGAISYHAQGSRDAVSGGRERGPAGDWEGDDEGNAPVIQLDWARDVSPVLSLGAQLQWSFLQLDGSDRHSDFSAWQQRNSFSRSFTDSYDLRGVIPPQAPYAGAGLGFGPLLDNIPSRRDSHETAGATERAVYSNEIRQSFDLDVNTLSLGPTAAFRFQRLSLQASAGFLLNIADWDASQHETLYLSRNGGPKKAVREWRDHSGGTDFLPGFYLQAGLSCQLTQRLSLTGFGRREWSDKLEGQVGPSTFKADLSGWSAGLMLGLDF